LRNPPVDPPIVHTAAVPGGLAYFRLHESPRAYYSEYGLDRIEWLAEQLPGKWSGHNVRLD
jgi:hypothetical protein